MNGCISRAGLACGLMAWAMACATVPGRPTPPLRVACLGDSITAGGKVTWPDLLQQQLGQGYQVKNFGVGGATLIRTGRRNVWQQLPGALAFRPHIVTIALGTNDTVEANWQHIDRFESDLEALLEQLAGLPTHPRILLCTPTAMVLQTPGMTPARRANLTQRQPRLQQLCRRIRRLAATHIDRNVELVELNPVLRDRPQWILPGDGVHPNASGYQAIAQTLARRILRIGLPNIVLFLVDDMGWQDTSVPFWTRRTAFNDHFRTPGMERLARQGIRFTSAYAYPLCSPTRVSIMTGMNAARHHVTQWTLRRDHDPSQKHPTLASPAWRIEGLQPPTMTLPRLLKMHGYFTIHCGKAHFGAHGTPGEDPRAHGFDVNIAGHCAGGPGSYYGDRNFSAAWRGGDRIWDVPGLEQYHGRKINLTEALTRQANAAVEKAVRAGRPFYLYMAHYAVHAPWEADRRFVEAYRQRGVDEKEAVYASMIESMDASLRSILEKLEQLGVAGKTIILFASDNGGVTHGGRGTTPRGGGRMTHNWPLRAGKCSVYEGGIRVPMIVSWARPDPDEPLQKQLAIEPDSRCDQPVQVDDFLPTLCRWAGIDASLHIKHLDGYDITGYITGQSDFHRPQGPLFHYPHVYNYIPDQGYAPHSAMRSGRWKVIYFYDRARWELYDLATDIGEQHDLAAERPEILRPLAQRLVARLAEMGAQFPVDKRTGKPVEPVMDWR